MKIKFTDSPGHVFLAEATCALIMAAGSAFSVTLPLPAGVPASGLANWYPVSTGSEVPMASIQKGAIINGEIVISGDAPSEVGVFEILISLTDVNGTPLEMLRSQRLGIKA